MRPLRGRSGMLGHVKRSAGQSTANRGRGRRVGRYTLGARVYDVVSLEWPVYRPGRLAGIRLLRLRPGDRVLDIGCGTGLNFPAMQAAVGPTGAIVGVDQSEQMLARARARVRRHGWRNVDLVCADAADLNGAGPMSVEPMTADPFDAALSTFALSIIGDGAGAWRAAVQATRPGGGLAVVDLALPTGRWAVLAPLARLACFTGGVDLDRKPWRWVARDTSQVTQLSLRGGHIRVAAGSRPHPPAAGT